MTGMGTTVFERRVYYSSQEEGHAAPFRATWESTGLVRRQKEKGETWARVFTVVFLRKGRQGRVSTSGLARKISAGSAGV